MPRTVLVVDDTDYCADLLEIALAELPGIVVRVASTGKEALESLQREDVCALVTDVTMPRMDGFELLERIRADVRYLRLPVIVISGDSNPDSPARAYALGADAFFTKPYSPSAVRKTLEKLLYDT